MYTEEPDYFEEKAIYDLNNEFERLLDKSFPDYEPLDLNYLRSLEKKQQLENNIKDLLNSKGYKFKPIINGYRIYFKNDKDYKKFKMLYKNSGTLKQLKPIQNYYNLNSSQFVDYKFIKKY